MFHSSRRCSRNVSVSSFRLHRPTAKLGDFTVVVARRGLCRRGWNLRQTSPAEPAVIPMKEQVSGVSFDAVSCRCLRDHRALQQPSCDRKRTSVAEISATMKNCRSNLDAASGRFSARRATKLGVCFVVPLFLHFLVFRFFV